MVDFLLTQANLPFTLSLAFVFLLGAFEAFSLCIGYSLVGALDDWAPSDVDIDSDVDGLGGGSGLTGIAGWLCLDRLPLLIWFVLVLVSFSITGYISNYISLAISHELLPQSATLPIALFFTAFSCRYIGVLVARILPKNESSAVSIDVLLGSVGTVTIGCAIKGNPSEALVKDQYQQKHYVLVEPELPGIEFNPGTQVVLLRREGTVWSAARFDS
ncbi:Protein of unknown function (DUF1449) [Shewanella psychrophila]|uniref:Membrane protein implicated in regulation of membrane protease activity n=1 Tax=Shewanella psychrophila TaxID=225848 RepID=A0A1S6HQD5_9GAMM|nr:OB-fold-containig protein [Shewanella psychrophila]AQS37745.1 Protein of unknown function (DUF1449) [Shewanella psychrophila]